MKKVEFKNIEMPGRFLFDNLYKITYEDGDVWKKASGYYYQSEDVDKILDRVREVCAKFVKKVRTGRARSVETYADCLSLIEMIDRER